MDESETETFWKSKFERDRDETESLVPLVSRSRWENDDTLTNFFGFPLFWDETRPEISGKLHKRTSLRPRLISNQNGSETETRPRVSVPLVSKPRRDRESRQSVLQVISIMCFKHWCKIMFQQKKILLVKLWIFSIISYYIILHLACRIEL
jgi:hypothetical protein